MFGTFDISTSGMKAQRVRMNVVAQNLANANSILDENGQPNAYRRQVALFAQGADDRGAPGVRVAGIAKDTGPLRRVRDPNSKYADKDGYVNYPNVDIIAENVDAMLAARAFEANVAAFELTKTMIGSALRILA
jgi:flagellar basal-body rod protein FlgC